MSDDLTQAKRESSSVQRQDSLSITWGKAWRQLVSDATLKLIPKGASFGVSVIATPVGGELAGMATKRLLRYLLRRYAHVYEEGEIKLTEFLGREIPERRYQGVGDFWAKILRDRPSFKDEKPLIQISGLLSPYGPLMPAHPMSRPGYTVEGWEAMGELETEDAEEYDTRDGFIYGDRVIRLSRPRHQKYYGGLYDLYFGISNVAIPLYVDTVAFDRKNRELQDLWQYPTVGGKRVTVKGRLTELPNFYGQFAGQLPEHYCRLPSFGLEVFKFEQASEPDGITHMAVSVSWPKRDEERMLTHYFNVQDRQQFITAEELLERGREAHTKALLFNYDDLACFSPEWKHKLPKYNEMLRPWLEGEKL